LAKGREGRDRAVQEQYEDYPYPPRDPEDERKRLIQGSPSNLSEINHYIFEGKRDFSAPFRALVAGGGTGDAAIMLAQQLSDAGTGGTVTYVDLSKASRSIAQARAKVRGLGNIEFHTGSLLDLPKMGLEPFDYIDCCGVLHHLDDPEEGLAALTAVLKDDGGMGIMVYATLGRTGVYHVQDALKLLVGDEPRKTQVPLAQKLVEQLPSTNWLVRNPFVGDHKLGEDAAFFDLLLHPRDRSYTVPEFLQYIKSANLELVKFIEPVKYDPLTYLKDKELIKRAKNLSAADQAALAENLNGTQKVHLAYICKQGGGAQTAKLAPNMIPVLKEGNPPEALAKAFKGRAEFEITFDGEKISFALPERSAQMAALIDGSRTLADIQKEMGLNWQNFRGNFAPFFKLLNSWNILWLRAG
jgi:ubiquinone/menaquinone biosynthesis C-methylase UbiE